MVVVPCELVRAIQVHVKHGVSSERIFAGGNSDDRLFAQSEAVRDGIATRDIEWGKIQYLCRYNEYSKAAERGQNK
jgi:hypothetical protein